jgi:hypothetical protein
MGEMGKTGNDVSKLLLQTLRSKMLKFVIDTFLNIGERTKKWKERSDDILSNKQKQSDAGGQAIGSLGFCDTLSFEKNPSGGGME